MCARTCTLVIMHLISSILPSSKATRTAATHSFSLGLLVGIALQAGCPGNGAALLSTQSPGQQNASAAADGIAAGSQEIAGGTQGVGGTGSNNGDSGAGLINSKGEVSRLKCQNGLASSSWVSCNSNERLQYKVDGATGATLLDFSSVGYRNGGVPLAVPPVARTLTPSGGDDTAAIQAALEACGALPQDPQGLRGSVLLKPGSYTVSRGLQIRQSGVSLQGTASTGPQASILVYTGSASTPLLDVHGASDLSGAGTRYAVASPSLASGSRTLVLQSVAGLRVGMQVQLTVVHNLAWITAMWGGSYPPVRDGAPQAAWGQSVTQDYIRRIQGINGNSVFLDAPLSDALPASAYAGPTGASLQVLADTGHLREASIAHLQLKGRYVPGVVAQQTQLTGISMALADDCYVDDVLAYDFGFSFVDLQASTQRITVQDMRMLRTGVQDDGAKPFDISIRGQQSLVQGCQSDGNKTFWALTQGVQALGPTVVQNYRTSGAGTFEPHMRWSTGVLYDNVYAPNGGVALIDRGVAGSGHGWAAGYSVVFNSLAGTRNTDKAGMNALPGFTIDQPPLAANWGIGLVGPNHSGTNSARLEGFNTPVAPASLWAHQLWQRGPNNALDTVIGPWQLRDSKTDTCLAPAQPQAGSMLQLGACATLGQMGLWDITSRNSIRLGGTSLCLDVGDGKAGSPVRLAACSDSGFQHLLTDSRAGFLSTIGYSSTATATPSICIGANQGQPLLVACDNASRSWVLLIATLAR